jgi:hypothetical protein
MPDGSVNWEQQRQIVQTPQPTPGKSVQTIEPITQALTLQNMGEGVAFNIHSMLYRPIASAGNQYVSWNNGPLQGKSSIDIVCTHGGMILDRDTRVDGVHLLYDPSEVNYRVARLTTTYHDLFGIRHVSIFDYITCQAKGIDGCTLKQRAAMNMTLRSWITSYSIQPSRGSLSNRRTKRLTSSTKPAC